MMESISDKVCLAFPALADKISNFDELVDIIQILLFPRGLRIWTSGFKDFLVIKLDHKSEFFPGLHKVFAQQRLLLQEFLLTFKNLASKFLLIGLNWNQSIGDGFQSFTIFLRTLLKELESLFN